VAVLIVEDNADLAESMRMLLELHGCRARVFLNANDLIEREGSVEPGDILVTDYYLPDLNGVELIRRMRKRHPRLQALLLTGSREDAIQLAARRLGGCGVLYKPVEFAELRAHIDAHGDAHAADAGLRPPEASRRGSRPRPAK
jgi:DNA-binding response OmpR family regulator